MSNRMAGLAVLMVLVIAALPATVGAQDREMTNLQVLSEDLTRREVTQIMRGFTSATGYRCSDCHVGEEDQPLSEYDFASDDRVLKEKAREMLRMTMAINQQYLAAVPDRGDPAVEVTCMTCHGGVARPEGMESLLVRVAAAEGGAGAAARYRELREEYFGQRAYDFSLGPIVEAASSLAGADAADAAVTLLDMANEYFPESAQVAFSLGQVHEVRADTAAALAAYRRVLELQPNQRGALQRIEALGGG